MSQNAEIAATWLARQTARSGMQASTFCGVVGKHGFVVLRDQLANARDSLRLPAWQMRGIAFGPMADIV